jgi:hypothetical protein
VEEWGSLNAVLTEAAATRGATGAVTRAVFRGRTSDGAIDIAPSGESAGRDGATRNGEPDGPPELVVCASGNLGLTYFPRLPGRATLEQIESTWPGLVSGLARHPGVGLLMVRSEARGAVAVGPSGVHYLDEQSVEGADPVAQFGEHALDGLLRLDRMEHCGDVVAISRLDPETDEVAAFEELIGSHGGLGGPQTDPFILHPAEWTIDEPIIGAEAVYRQLRAWLRDIGIELGPSKAAPSSQRTEPAVGNETAPRARAQ